MTITDPALLFQTAIDKNKAVCAFNVIQIEHAEAIVAAAEQSGADVILQLSQNAVAYHGALEPIGLAMLSCAKNSSSRIAVHLDHADDEDLIAESLNLGFNSIMFDGSKFDYETNVDKTIQMARLTKSKGAWLEAELGEIGGKDGVHAATARTVPAEATEFVAATGVNSLAVAIGSSHAMTSQDARIDFELVSELAAAVNIPLVMHGSSGVALLDIQKAVSLGIRKVNISTELNKSMTEAIKTVLSDNPAVVDPRKYFAFGRQALKSSTQAYLEAISR
jgi:fructose-bisphosphate aldolase class II